ncbi:MAG TPA: DUF2971 domain-containing protein [Gammaproteobacteria bacterium]
MAEPSTESIFSERPPETLYHYTTQSGLLGILESESIWLTHTQYLNDSKEFVHALSIAQTEIEENLARASGKEAAVWDEMHRAIKEMSPMNVCVCSFSENKDSLSQWRAYGGESSGFAIGISRDLLLHTVDERSFYMARCIYDPDLQRKFIRRIVAGIFSENIEKVRTAGALLADEDALDDWLPEGGNLVARLQRYAPVLKDQAFEEEREWRIISRPMMAKRLSFREGKSTIVPYCNLPIGGEKKPFAINEVVIGPTVAQGRAVRAVSSLLVHRKHKDVSVTLSKVPYRTW